MKCFLFILSTVLILTYAQAQSQNVSRDSLSILSLLEEAKKKDGYDCYDLIEKAKSLAQKINHRGLIISSYYELVWYHRSNDQFHDSQKYIDSILQLAESANDLASQAKALNAKAAIMADYGSYDLSAQALNQAVDIHRQLNNSEIVNTLTINLAELRYVQGHYEQALTLYRDLRDQFSGKKDSLEISVILSGLGKSYLKLDQLDSAYQCLESAYGMYNRLGATSRKINAMLRIASTVQRADELNFELPRKFHLLDNRVDVILDTCLNYANQINALDLQVDVLEAKTNYFESIQDFQRALTSNRQMHDIFDSTKLSDDNLSAFVSMRRELEMEKQKSQIEALKYTATISQLQHSKRTRQRNHLLLLSSLLIISLVLSRKLLRTQIATNRMKLTLRETHIHKLKQQKEVEVLEAIMEGSEKEKERISKELHDGIGNLLVTSMHKIEKTLGSNIVVKDELRQISTIIEEAHEEVRNISHEMMPVSLKRIGLIPALRELCRRMDGTKGIRYHFQNLGDYHPLRPQLESMIYRSAQEIIQNIQKHSEATEAILQISNSEEEMVLTIEDNGKGFDRKTTDGFGLRSIRSRIEYLSGALEVNSSNVGTTYYFSIPTTQ